MQNFKAEHLSTLRNFPEEPYYLQSLRDLNNTLTLPSTYKEIKVSA